jgi:hypothetical protein
VTRDARLISGISLLFVPTVVYGGLTVLGVLSGGDYGAPAPQELTPLQTALYRAGHAHAGVLLVLSLVLQIALDDARLGSGARWTARITAPLAAMLVSGGFFGLAHVPVLRWLLYLGALCVVVASVITGVGLVRSFPRLSHGSD